MRYLFITYVKKPDGKIDEMMNLGKKIRKIDSQTVNVILDFKTLAVVKCSMGGVNVPRDFNRIVEYYMQYYESAITRLFKENGYEVEFEKHKEEAPSRYGALQLSRRFI